MLAGSVPAGFRRVCAIVAAAAFLVPTEAAAASQALTPERVARIVWLGPPSISPDGSRILYVRSALAAAPGSPANGIWLMDAGGGAARFVVAGRQPLWSPDGASFAYFATAPDGGEQLFVHQLARGESRQLTRVAKSVGMASWSADGRWIAFCALLSEPAPWELALPSLPAGVEEGGLPFIVDELHYRESGTGLLERGYEHLFVVSADGQAEPRQLTSGRWHVGARETGRIFRMSSAVSWAPDGRTIFVDGLDAPDHDLRSRESDLHAVSVVDGHRKRLTRPAAKGYWMEPRVSPDGRWVAYRGYDWDAPHASRPLALWVARADGSEPRALSTPLDEDATGFLWSPRSDGLYFNVGRHGRRSVYFAPLRGEPRQAVAVPGLDIQLSSVSRNGIAVGLTTGEAQLPEIVRVDLRRPGHVVPLTQVSRDLLEGVDLGRVEEFWYTGPGDLRMQAWIFYPPRFDPTRRHPLVTYLHGGPRYMGNASLDWLGTFSIRNLAAEGYVVLYPNYRGNDGYGTAVADAIVDAWPGENAAADVHAAIDHVVARGFVDTGRLALMGESAGGALATWMLGHTRRFSAAIALWPDTDWVHSSLAADDALLSYQRFPGALWKDPGPWLRASPVYFADRITTPTLLMTGDQDLRTPIAHIEELFAAMKIANRTRVRMVRLTGQGHGYGMTVPNYIRTQHYLSRWLDENR